MSQYFYEATLAACISDSLPGHRKGGGIRVL